MEKFLFKNVLLVSATTLALSPAIASANEEGSVYVVPSIGTMGFDDDRIADTDGSLSIGLGYNITKSIAAELIYSKIGTEDETAIASDLDVTQTRIDGLYHFAKNGNWQPFIVGGAGDASFEYDGQDSDHETMLNLGAGIKYLFSKAISVRGDVRAFQGIDEGLTDYGANITLMAQFGGSSQSTSKPMPFPVAQVEPEPVAPIIEEVQDIDEGLLADNDNDGVTDANDQCPETRDGVAVDNLGCDRDDDFDGVANWVDSCPETKAGAKVNQVGCHIALKEKIEMALEVGFDTNSAQSRQSDLAEIARIADFMKQYPDAKISIEGHTDSMGQASYNKDLSQRRAQSIVDVLSKQFGIDMARIKAKGYGEELPVAENGTSTGRQANRRVVAVVEAEVEKQPE